MYFLFEKFGHVEKMLYLCTLNCEILNKPSLLFI